MEKLPFDVVVGRPQMKALGGILDLKSSVIKFDVGGVKISLPMIPENDRPTTAGDDTASEDFTSESSSDEFSDKTVEDRQEEEEEIFLMIGKDFESKQEKEEPIAG